MSVIKLKRFPNFSIIAALLLSVMFIQSALASDDEKKSMHNCPPVIMKSGKRLREGQQEINQQELKGGRIEASNYFDNFVPELQQKVFSYLGSGGHETLNAFTSSTVGQDSQFNKIRFFYKFLTPNNLQYSIHPIHIIKDPLRRPLSFYFYEEGFTEISLRSPPLEGIEVTKYNADEKDIQTLNLFFRVLNKIDQVTVTGAMLPQNLPILKSFLESLTRCNVKSLEIKAPLVTKEELDNEPDEIYEEYFSKYLWSHIRKIKSLQSLSLNLLDDVKYIMRSIMKKDLPLEHFILKTDIHACPNTLALLIANSSHLKTLTLKSNEICWDAFETVMISVTRNKKFEKFIIDASQYKSQFDEENQKKLREFAANNNKFEFRE
jgi:hypothetical protein